MLEKLIKHLLFLGKTNNKCKVHDENNNCVMKYCFIQYINSWNYQSLLQIVVYQIVL